MNGRYSEMNVKHLSYLSMIMSWHQVTLLDITNQLDLCQLRLLASKMINLRILTVLYQHHSNPDDLNQQNLIDFLSDTSLCNMLMTNGLQRLNLYANHSFSDMIGIASLIVQQLPHLKIIELNCHNSRSIQIPETLHILINGLPKLNFIIFHGGLTGGDQQYSKMRDLSKNSTRTYQMKTYNPEIVFNLPMLYLWLR
jgi:hypothetical protein